jgi:hypothetical protein
MAELLFTEDQWREIVCVEDQSWQCRHLATRHDGKRVFGAAFSDGEFYVDREWDYLNSQLHGPRDISCTLYERTSGLVFAVARSHADAISNARGTMELIGPEYLARMFAEYRTEERAEELAEIDAREAIANAKAAKKAEPKKIGKRRRAIFEESGGKCHYCQTEITLEGNWHVEHKMPKALGGTDEPINLVASCAPCNFAKRDKTDLEFIALLAAKASV